MIGFSEEEPESKGRILYAEDDKGCREAGTRNLRRRGYEVIATEDGEKALESYRAEQVAGRTIDFVITDINMPNLPGFRLIKALREEGFGGPIAICSGTEVGVDFMKDYKVLVSSTSTRKCLEACEEERAR